MDGWMDGGMDGLVEGWMEEWIDGWRNLWISGWRMVGWMDEQTLLILQGKICDKVEYEYIILYYIHIQLLLPQNASIKVLC